MSEDAKANTSGPPPIRVLIVDDEPDVRMLLRVQLEHSGFDIVGEAADGRAALDQCREHAPDAIILDLLMPGMSGFEAIAPLREMKRDVAIVAYTAVAGDFVRKEMARLDVPLLLKSGDSTPLVNKIREVVAARAGAATP
ncbi:MAG TPA: response regulator [Acidimicrobiales bacterium]